MQDESLVNDSGARVAVTEADAQYAALASWHKGFPYGEQWGISNELRSLVVSWIQSAVPDEAGSVIVELGSGGGRWTHRLHRAASKLVAIDRGPASRREIERVYGRLERCTYMWPADTKCPPVVEGDQVPSGPDYVFSYDTLVHFHSELFWATLRMLFGLGARVVHLHWGHSDVASQREAGAGCFFYYSLADVMTLAEGFGYALTRTHVINGGFGSILGEFKCERM